MDVADCSCSLTARCASEASEPAEAMPLWTCCVTCPICCTKDCESWLSLCGDGLRLARSQRLHFLAEHGELRVLTAAGEGARAPRRECGGRGDNKDGGKVHEVTLARPGI